MVTWETVKQEIGVLLPMVQIYNSLGIDWLVQDHLAASRGKNGWADNNTSGHLRLIRALKAFQPASSAADPKASAFMSEQARAKALTELPAVAEELKSAFFTLECPDCLYLPEVRYGAQGPFHRDASGHLPRPREARRGLRGTQ